MPESVTARRVVVLGTDGDAVGREVARRRAAGERAAGFVGEEEATARAMAEEMLGGLDELVVLP
ncbi:MAG: hypothetical protein ACRD0N_04465 [Acidimicrobiales bacterium]